MERLIIITGASGGIGKYLFDKFFKLNLDVIGGYHSHKERGMYRLDVTDDESVENFVKLAHPQDREVVLINCAAINYNKMLHRSCSVLWEDVIDVNLTGTMRMVSKVLPHMRKKGWGRIIMFSSIVPDLGIPGTSAYSASKMGLEGLSKVIAKENSDKGVTSNVIKLGYVNTGMTLKDVPDEILDRVRLCDVEEVYSAVLFLTNSKDINGSIIKIDGGI